MIWSELEAVRDTNKRVFCNGPHSQCNWCGDENPGLYAVITLHKRKRCCDSGPYIYCGECYDDWFGIHISRFPDSYTHNPPTANTTE
jgi:hypothetical protein